MQVSGHQALARGGSGDHRCLSRQILVNKHCLWNGYRHQQPARLQARMTPAPCQSSTSSLITLEEVQQAARRRGMHLSVKELGPFYRVVCRDRSEEGKVLGVTSGFVAPPFGIMHCDTLQIFTRGIKGQEGQRLRGGALGLGLLLGGATFAHGHAAGCRTAEILAINDDDTWHERLVRYYSFFGFKPVCKVGGNGLSDVPHMLVWGGEGTRMDADIQAMLRKWTPSLRREARGEAGPGGGGDQGTGSAAGAGSAREEGQPTAGRL